jgi:hypothetical protein
MLDDWERAAFVTDDCLEEFCHALPTVSRPGYVERVRVAKQYQSFNDRLPVIDRRVLVVYVRNE